MKLRIHQPRRLVEQYEFLNVISRGAYGVVYRARDVKTNEIVAVKNEIHGMCRSTEIEIDILKTLPKHPCIVGFKKATIEEGASVFVVMEHMEFDLFRFRQSWNKPFNLNEIKFFMQEILEGVKFLHEEGVMHRDLKPSNILFTPRNGGQIKICDFGLSARFDAMRSASYCPRVGTVWYKAPELLCGSWKYTCAVDMWAVGCIMAELVLDQVLFPGNSEDEQLECIHRVINPPFNRIADKVETVALFQETTQLTPCGVDLHKRLLAYEPEQRITAADALIPPWFSE